MNDFIKYAQRITINDFDDKIVMMAVNKLLYSMFEQSKDRNEFVEFFKMNLTNSEKVLNAKDIILEWAVVNYKTGE